MTWLLSFPGDTWQERWDASAIESADDFRHVISKADNTLVNRKNTGSEAMGVSWLLVIDAIRPSYEWLYRNLRKLQKLSGVVLPARDPEGFDALDNAIQRRSKRPEHVRKTAFPQLARIMVHTGIQRVADVTIEDIREAYEVGARVLPTPPGGEIYNVMSWAQFLPQGSPTTWGSQIRVGRLTVEQLVDRTGIKSSTMRDLFVVYIKSRATGLDYSTVTGLVNALVDNFWCHIEDLQPGINTLRIPLEVLVDWKEQVQVIRKGRRQGQPRKDHSSVLIAVRGFYFDINDWAQTHPERFGAIAAPNPITADDLRGISKIKRKQRAQSHERTRERLPLIETLTLSVEDRRAWHAEALAAASDVELGETFEVDGVSLQRTTKRAGAVVKGSKTRAALPPIWVRRHDTDVVFDARLEEDRTFWQWAIVGVLKETGIRIEEFEELAVTSLSQFTVPSTGETVPLLQIAPSKTDKERVILMSPDLADVLSSILDRIRDEHGLVPPLDRWDPLEKQVIPASPLLMQRIVNGRRVPIKRGWVAGMLNIATLEADLRDGAGRLIRFQPHDFRRLFATEAVMSGLAPHIAAKVLGHDSLDTLQQYVAVYDEDVFLHHRQWIERRRRMREDYAVEYREPTDDEWQEFLADFEERELELGSCGRAFGTPCVHEHACLRCSLLRVKPDRRTNLVSRIENLEKRLAEAKRRSWKGEITMLGLSLSGARSKLTALDKKVGLGLPSLRPGL